MVQRQTDSKLVNTRSKIKPCALMILLTEQNEDIKERKIGTRKKDNIILHKYQWSTKRKMVLDTTNR